MDCLRGTTTVDLCSEPECVNRTVQADGVSHLPNHGMFKVRRVVFSRDIAQERYYANNAINSARETIVQLKKEEKTMPKCVRCETPVSLPCWYCAECAGDSVESRCQTIEVSSILTSLYGRGFHMRRL
jgi:hypothetical protein